MRYTIEIPRETREMIGDKIGSALWLATNDIVNDIVMHCPVDTGFTRNTVWGEVEGSTIIIHAGGAIHHIEYGTPPHEITPKTKKALHWEGADHPVKKVMHPGTRANPIVRSALHRGMAEYIPNRLTEVFTSLA